MLYNRAMRGSNQAQANGLLFGARTQKDSPKPELTKAEKEALELAQEKSAWLAKGGEITEENGTTRWSIDGKLHRDGDKPAVERGNGDLEWWQMGTKHRDGGPCFIGYNGDKEWRQNGLLHRDDGLPSIEDESGHREWHVHGRRHRLNGPAIIYPEGDCQYWVDGEKEDRGFA